MKAQDLQLEEVVAFNEGDLSLHGRRLVLHDFRALAQLRRDLVDMLGTKQTRQVLTRFGYFWGNADAAAMTRIFTWANLEEWLKAGPRMSALQGVAKWELEQLDMDAEAGRFEMTVSWRDSGEAQEYLVEMGRANECVCWILAGYASGYATFCFGKNVYFVEQECRAHGDRLCRAVGKDVASWGSEIQGYLQYFQAVDHIQDSIREFTQELKDKNAQLARQRKKIHALEESNKDDRSNLVGTQSAVFGRVMDVAARVARFDTSLLITGESGVGKEVLARHIHGLSPRADQPFVAVNCGALPETLLESELFGHKAGAFTGAIHDRVGLFEEASGGVIFLDEVGDITPAMQLKLLRVLQEQEILRVGESRVRKIDVRVIAATNRDLAEAIKAGEFREDLFYRLGVVEIKAPPLRERPEDILPLARHFVKQLTEKLERPGLRIDARCLDYLLAYPWPGNVRELQNAIERTAVLSDGDLLRPEHLPPQILHQTTADANGKGMPETLADIEKRHILAVLEKQGHNRTRAAATLGISQATLWRKLKRYENAGDNDSQ